MRNTLPTSNADIGLGSQSSSWLGGLRIDNMPSLNSISNFASRSMSHGSNHGLPSFTGRATQRRSSFNMEKTSPQLPNPATSPTFNRSANPLLSPIFTVPQQATSAVRKALSNTNSVSFTPDTIKFVMLCILWYTSSAVTNNTGKQIMNVFRFPLTLTFVQFGFVSGYCFIWANVFGFGRIKYPTRQIIETTMPLSLFQVAGHIFSSLAIARVPVSFVHTIKALSPLFTVMAYGLMFNVKYSLRTYVSLIPLTLGVMLACSFSSFQSTSNLVGFICALGSTLIFVSQNIFSKKLLFGDTRAASHRRVKLDKINLLFYSSGMAFLLMIPIWLWYDGYTLVSTGFALTAHHSGTSIPLRFIINGSAHWGQNVIAFSILAITSTVTYSIASLVKRIFVIVASIIWFGQSTTFVQGLGITMTFVGLYMYQQAKTDVDRGERAMRKAEVQQEALLPMNAGEQRDDVMLETKDYSYGQTNGHMNGYAKDYGNGYPAGLDSHRHQNGYMNGYGNGMNGMSGMNGNAINGHAEPAIAATIAAPPRQGHQAHRRESLSVNTGPQPPKQAIATGVEVMTSPTSIETPSTPIHAKIAPPPRKMTHPPPPPKIYPPPPNKVAVA